MGARRCDGRARRRPPPPFRILLLHPALSSGVSVVPVLLGPALAVVGRFHSLLHHHILPLSARSSPQLLNISPPWQAALHTGSQTLAILSQTKGPLRTLSLRASTQQNLSAAMPIPVAMPVLFH